MVPEDLPYDVVFPEHCRKQVASPDGNNCSVYITIPTNAIIYQRNVERTYVHAYIYMHIDLLCMYSARNKDQKLVSRFFKDRIFIGY